MALRLEPNLNSLLYAGKVLVGCLIAWFTLLALGIGEPIWAAITVVIVSEPDFVRAREQVRARVINTLTGCAVSLVGIQLFGGTLTAMFVSVAVAVLLVTSIKSYPTSWKLAPVTVLILTSAALKGASTHQEMELALLRTGEIIYSCCIVLLLSALITRVRKRWPDATE